MGARPETAVCLWPAELAELQGEAEQAVGVFASDDLCRVLRVLEVSLRGRGVTKTLGVIFGAEYDVLGSLGELPLSPLGKC